MKYRIKIEKTTGGIRLNKLVKDGDVIPVESGDKVLILDENGDPANAVLTRVGNDLKIDFSVEKINILLEDYFSLGGEGSFVPVILSPDADASLITAWLAEFKVVPIYPTRLEDKELRDDFTLMRLSGDADADFNGAQGSDFTLENLTELFSQLPNIIVG